MRRIPVAVALFAKPKSVDAAVLREHIAAWFAERGVKTRILDSHAEAVAIARDVQGCDLALVIGGDGSMIAVGRRLLGLGVPILGINMGTLGFLTEVSGEDWQERCEQLLDKGFMVRERMALSLRLFRGESEIPMPAGVCPGAVNDVMFSRATLARVINLAVHIDGQPFARFRGDGLLVSSPVGTTGYAMSAGGVMLHPDLHVMEITPVCPVLHSMRPLVTQGTAVIRIGQTAPWAEVGVTVDGQDCFFLEPNDWLEVRAAERGTLFASVEELSYWRRLGAKGFVSCLP